MSEATVQSDRTQAVDAVLEDVSGNSSAQPPGNTRDVQRPHPTSFLSAEASEGVEPLLSAAQHRGPGVGFVQRAMSLLARGVVLSVFATTAGAVALVDTMRRSLEWRPGREPVRRAFGHRSSNSLERCLHRAASLDGATLLVTGTFYNEGWFRSHILPLGLCGAVRRVVLVCDRSLGSADKIEFACPPRWLVRCIGRSAARLLTLVRVTLSERPDVLMGYHIMPNALWCLVLGRMIGARVFYQMTGGPSQIKGGGWQSENRLLRRQGKPGRVREALLYHLVRRFDRVIVRGGRARRFVERGGLARRCAVIPGAVDTGHFSPDVTGAPEAGSSGADRSRAATYDIVYVGRLAPVKRPDRVIEILRHLARRRPESRAAIVGDGPLAEQAQRQVRDGGLSECVHFLGRLDDVAPVVRRSRLFLLASENEGLSIALLEAMAAGLPAVVPNVGDLAEVVRPGETGVFIEPNQPERAAEIIAALLAGDTALRRLSENARATATRYADLHTVAQYWEMVLRDGAVSTAGRGAMTHRR